ncbi:unnamed protein product [Gadus morhua 'NCC']
MEYMVVIATSRPPVHPDLPVGGGLGCSVFCDGVFCVLVVCAQCSVMGCSASWWSVLSVVSVGVFCVLVVRAQCSVMGCSASWWSVLSGFHAAELWEGPEPLKGTWSWVCARAIQRTAGSRPTSGRGYPYWEPADQSAGVTHTWSPPTSGRGYPYWEPVGYPPWELEERRKEPSVLLSVDSGLMSYLRTKPERAPALREEGQGLPPGPGSAGLSAPVQQ